MGPAEPKVEAESGALFRPNPLIKDWAIQLNTWPRKLIAIALVLAVCGTLVYRTWWLFLAAWITRANETDPRSARGKANHGIILLGSPVRMDTGSHFLDWRAPSRFMNQNSRAMPRSKAPASADGRKICCGL